MSDNGRLHLFLLFHGNLAFSSIPSRQYAEVVDRCYWPALEMVESLGIPVAFEFPAATLEVLSVLDPSFVRRLGKMCATGQIEFVGSGYMQTIGPLMPADVTAHNLALGIARYHEILGVRPTTALINEQVYSAGLPGLLREAGFDAFIMDWQNPFSSNRFPVDKRYRPQLIKGAGGATCPVLWSHSTSFQQFQRCVHGLVPIPNYLSSVFEHHDPKEDRVLGVYTNDLEVFDFRPGKPSSVAPGGEFARMALLLETLVNDSRAEFALPHEIASRFPCDGDAFALETAQIPLPTKKQQKYSAVRWAVCGRTSALINAACYEIYALLKQAEAFTTTQADELVRLRRELVYLWGSDFRTHTTHEKDLVFSRQYGSARKLGLDLVPRVIETLATEPGTLGVLNPHEVCGPFVVDVPLRSLPEGAFPDSVGLRGLQGGDDDAVVQVEDVRRHRDGSLRSAHIVAEFSAPPRDTRKFEFYPAGHSDTDLPASIHHDDAAITVTTPQVKIVLSPRRGGAIKSLAFPEIASQALLGTVPHGSFEDIRYGADFYSGHTVGFTRDGQKFADLDPAGVDLPSELSPASHRIRIPITFRIDKPIGALCKTYHIYLDQPRVDLTYEFYVRPTPLASLRLGFVTVLPGAFSQGSLYYATVNGGRDVESWQLGQRPIDHGAPVSLVVSARQCLGATEGWVSIGDDQKGVAVICKRRRLCAVPMIEYRRLEQTFLRIAHSVVELDETSANLWRGHYSAKFALVGYRAGGIEAIRTLASQLTIPPVVGCKSFA